LQRHLWSDSYLENNPPFWPCPARSRETLQPMPDSLSVAAAARPLNDRIKEFEAIDASHAETFDALREVGNVGSHQGDNTRETVLDAWEVYEDAFRVFSGGTRAGSTH
jgi:hypothetical protein